VVLLVGAAPQWHGHERGDGQQYNDGEQGLQSGS
jgi:hypothetical protein